MTIRAPAVRPAARWVVAIAISIAVLGAFAVRAGATGERGVRESLDSARIVAACLLAVGAALAAVRTSRHEAVGFALAAASLGLAVAADRVATRWLEGGGDVAQRVAIVSAAWSLAVLALPSIAGSAMLSIPPSDLLRAPRRQTAAFVAAAVAGVFLFPALSFLDTGVDVAVREILGPTVAGPSPGWPSLRAALLRETLPGSSAAVPLHVFLQIGLQYPLMETFLHGVLRQAFLRWGSMPFVVGTALLSSLIAATTRIDLAAFGGMIVTGLFAARTGSVLPGFVFWTARYLGWVLWSRLLLPP